MTTNGDDDATDDVSDSALTWTACGLAGGTLVVLVLGVLSTIGREQTPTENFLLALVLAAISVGAGWIFAELSARRQAKRKRSEDEKRRVQEQREIERNALSSVRRIFAIMVGFGRIESAAIAALEREGNTALDRQERTTALQIIIENARTHRLQAEDSVKDWRHFAPEIIDEELEKIEAADQPQLEGEAEDD